MASEGEANKARRAHSNVLTKKGVFAVGIEPGESHGHQGWVVVAHVEPNAKVQLPSTLSSPGADAKTDVPLVVRRGKPFMPE